VTRLVYSAVLENEAGEMPTELKRASKTIIRYMPGEYKQLQTILRAERALVLAATLKKAFSCNLELVILRLLSNSVAIVNLTGEHYFMGSTGKFHSNAPSSALNYNRNLIHSVLKGRLLVLVAHQDDETACSGLLQRSSDQSIAYATDGAPADDFFWARHGSRAAYSGVRRSEASAATAKIGVSNLEFLNFGDQLLYCALDAAFLAVFDIVRRYKPDTVLVPAYEGGHPDHDSCSFLAALLRRKLGLSVWEMPLYHRSTTGKLISQRFRQLNGTECVLLLSSKEQQTREGMIESYASQTDLHDFISGKAETCRPQPDYDYSRPAHEGLLNYEVWNWPMSGAQVCHAFNECADAIDQRDHPPAAPAQSV
jgi:LmbE family N-acetylglucosaminyl deacetylase